MEKETTVSQTNQETGKDTLKETPKEINEETPKVILKGTVKETNHDTQLDEMAVRKLLVRKHLETHLNEIMGKWITSYSSGCTGGKMRGDRGNDLEIFVRDSINHIAEVEKVSLKAVKGSQDKKELKTKYKGKDIVKQHQVDVHIYKNEQFTAVIECKAYLDSCYYVRACDDFHLFKKFGYDIKKYIFTLEDSLDEDTKVFTDFVNDNVCDDIFIMLDGKRSSSKPIYDKKYAKDINKKKLDKYIDAIYNMIYEKK